MRRNPEAMKNYCCSVVYLFLAFQILEVEGQSSGDQYVFEVQAHSYTNSASRLFTGICCDGRVNNCRTDCNNVFDFCLRRAGTDPANDSCPLGLYSQIRVGRDDSITSFGNVLGQSFNTEVANPLVFNQLQQPWPAEGVQLLVQITSLDDEDLELVNRIIFEQPNIQPGPEFSNRVANSSRNNRGEEVQLELSFRLRCGEDYYGDNCETLCIPQDDDRQGHYGCDDRGNIVCLPGYTGTDSLCTTCVPAEGCVTNQGFCEEPGECNCLAGYTGAMCETAISAAACDVGGICLNGGSCVIDMDSERGYRCQCTNGRQGDNCEIAVTTGANNDENSQPGTTEVSGNSQPGTTEVSISVSSSDSDGGNARNSPSTEQSDGTVTTGSVTGEDPAVVGQGNEQQTSGGEVAGIVIAILLVLVLLAVAGGVGGFFLYRYKPFWKDTKKEVLENPTYDMVAIGANRNVVLTHLSPPVGQQPNGSAHTPNNLTRSVDNGDPLYASTAIGDYATYDLVEGTDSEMPRYEVSTSNTLPTSQKNANFLGQSYSHSMENLVAPTGGHIGSAHSTPSKVNPYGDYGDQTLLRVASNFSLHDHDEEEGQHEHVFDNPDYEDVHNTEEAAANTPNGVTAAGTHDQSRRRDGDYEDVDIPEAAASTPTGGSGVAAIKDQRGRRDGDYEDIYDKDKDYDDI